jgi:flavin reductase (DIM6/NTAB) family NADH-FMN oxidoreductase RutF
VDKGSESYPHFESSGIFAVNLLSQDQKALSQRFAVSGGDKFSGLDWHRGLLATPILAGTLGHLECRIRHVYDGGDHTIYVGEVEAAKGCEGDPLVYFRGKYRSVRDL